MSNFALWCALQHPVIRVGAVVDKPYMSQCAASYKTPHHYYPNRSNKTNIVVPNNKLPSPTTASCKTEGYGIEGELVIRALEYAGFRVKMVQIADSEENYRALLNGTIDLMAAADALSFNNGRAYHDDMQFDHTQPISEDSTMLFYRKSGQIASMNENLMTETCDKRVWIILAVSCFLVQTVRVILIAAQSCIREPNGSKTTLWFNFRRKIADCLRDTTSLEPTTPVNTCIQLVITSWELVLIVVLGAYANSLTIALSTRDTSPLAPFKNFKELVNLIAANRCTLVSHYDDEFTEIIPLKLPENVNARGGRARKILFEAQQSRNPPLILPTNDEVYQYVRDRPGQCVVGVDYLSQHHKLHTQYPELISYKEEMFKNKQYFFRYRKSLPDCTKEKIQLAFTYNDVVDDYDRLLLKYESLYNQKLFILALNVRSTAIETQQVTDLFDIYLVGCGVALLIFLIVCCVHYGGTKKGRRKISGALFKFNDDL